MTTYVTPAADHVAGPRRPDAARLARAALTRLVEPGDALAVQTVTALGPERALALLTGRSGRSPCSRAGRRSSPPSAICSPIAPARPTRCPGAGPRGWPAGRPGPPGWSRSVTS
ncbi:DNA protecting protein DprA (fragment) [Micrococcus luteus]